MSQIKLVTPNNLGKTIKAGALEPNKYDVVLNTEQLQASETGAIGLKPEFVSTLKGKGVQAFVKDRTTVRLTLEDSTNFEVDLADLIPEAKADHLLKAVAKSEDGTKLVFTVGAKDSEEGQTTVELPLSEIFQNANGGDGLEGNGSAANPYKIKFASGNSTALTAGAEGLKLDETTLATNLAGKVKPKATVELVDAFGEHIGWALVADERVEA